MSGDATSSGVGGKVSFFYRSELEENVSSFCIEEMSHLATRSAVEEKVSPYCKIRGREDQR